MSQQFQQQPFQPAPKPPKKQRKWLPWAGGAAAFILGIAVGAAPSSNSATEAGSPAPTVTVTVPNTGPSPEPVVTPTDKPTASKSTKPAEQAPKVTCADQDDRNAPCAVQVGKPFELGKHTVLLGWKVASEYGTMSVTGKAKNTGGETSTMFIDVKFLKGDDVLAVVSCSTDELEPGQTQALSCFGTDSFTKKYDRVTAEATF